MYVCTEFFWNFIKKDRNEKKAIYLDEIWRLIGVTSNKEVASFVYKIFKTIRKYGGSAVAITQDISDLFSLQEGNFGKSILNNTSIKHFFALEEENIKVLKNYTNISEKEALKKINSIDKKRESYYGYYAGKDWGACSSYELSVDTSVLGTDKAAQLIKNYIELRNCQ